MPRQFRHPALAGEKHEPKDAQPDEQPEPLTILQTVSLREIFHAYAPTHHDETATKDAFGTVINSSDWSTASEEARR